MTKKFCNIVQVYNLDGDYYMFEHSCNKCINQKYCSRSKKRRANCELKDTINELETLDIRAQISGIETKIFVSTETYAKLQMANLVLRQVKENYSK